MKVAIVVDDAKLLVFRRRLTEAGFEYSDAGAFVPNITTLIVITDEPDKLENVVVAAMQECGAAND